MTPAASTDERLRPYVAGLAIDWLQSTPDVTHRSVEGSLAFVDISGFTRLTERLAARGKVGAEEMSDILDATFGRLLEVAYSYGALLVKWGGDAVLLLFEGDDHAALACRAAYEMRTTMRAIGQLSTSVGAVTLRMSVGVNSGEFDFFLVGDEQRELLVLGSAASETAQLEGVADAGEIVIGTTTADLLPQSCVGASRGRGVLLRSAPDAVQRCRCWPRSAEPFDFAQCLDPQLVERLLADTGDSEHRHVSVGFIEVSGVDRLIGLSGTSTAASHLGRLVTTVQRECARHHVTFWETDISKDGFKILLVSGAPISTGHDEEALLHTARSILDAHDGPLSIRIGANCGRVFSGVFGPPFRRTFSVKGDAVNLAARVMGKSSSGELLATSTILAATHRGFETRAVAPFMVKGKRRPVDASVVGAVVSVAVSHDDVATPFVGRDNEIAVLTSTIQRAADGVGAAVAISGDGGIGKSRLIDEVCRQLPDGTRVIRTSCDEYESATAYFPFRALLQSLLGSLSLVDAVAHAGLAQWAPLIGVPLGVRLPDTAETAALGADFRRSRTEQAIVDFVVASIDGPTLIVVEDVQHIDDASATLLQRLSAATAQHAFVVVTTTRGAVESGLALGPLSDADLTALVKATATIPLAPHRIADLVGRASGNPMFAIELTRRACEHGDDDELPATLEEMVAAQLDRLDPRDRSLLRAASVLGIRVNWPLVEQVTGEFVSPAVRRRLAPYVSDSSTPAFLSALVRDAAYEGLPFRRRVELHGRVGTALADAATDPDDVAEALSHHFFHARRYRDAWRFSRVAGERARSVNAYVEARTFYERAVTVARRLGDVDPLEIATDLEHCGDACVRVGETRQALVHYTAARKSIAGAPARLAAIELATARAAHRVGGAAPSMRWLRAARGHLDSIDYDAVLQTAIETEEAFARFTSGHLAAAERWCTSAVSHARTLADDVALAKALHLLDMIRVARHTPGDGAPAAEALAAATRAGDNIRRCQILIHLGARAYFDGDWPAALAHYETARAAGLLGGDVWLSAIVTSNIGEILLEQRRYTECEPVLREAYDVFRAADTPSPLAFTQTLLGRLCYLTGRTPEGTVLLESARALYVSLHLDDDVREVDVRRAEACVYDGRPSDALAMLDDDSPLAVRVRATALWELGQEDEAVTILRASASVGSRYDRCCALDLLGRWTTIDASEREEAAAIARQLGIQKPVVDLTTAAPIVIPTRSAGLPAASGT